MRFVYLLSASKQLKDNIKLFSHNSIVCEFLVVNVDIEAFHNVIHISLSSEKTLEHHFSYNMDKHLAFISLNNTM